MNDDPSNPGIATFIKKLSDREPNFCDGDIQEINFIASNYCHAIPCPIYLVNMALKHDRNINTETPLTFTKQQ